MVRKKKPDKTPKTGKIKQPIWTNCPVISSRLTIQFLKWVNPNIVRVQKVILKMHSSNDWLQRNGLLYFTRGFPKILAVNTDRKKQDLPFSTAFSLQMAMVNTDESQNANKLLQIWISALRSSIQRWEKWKYEVTEVRLTPKVAKNMLCKIYGSSYPSKQKMPDVPNNF